MPSMKRTIQVHMLPLLTNREELAGGTVVVIDILRATTTICYALAAGAREIIPCVDIDEARELRNSLGDDSAVLGGERGGVKVEGFDLGNSPSEYTPATVADRSIVFTTTNGTAAMKYCQDANEVLIGAFVNLSAICSALAGAENIHFLCAGTAHKITREDVLFAGAAIDLLLSAEGDEALGESLSMNDQANLALDAWRTAQEHLVGSSLADRIRESRGGQNVLAIGQEADIQIAAELDRFQIVPRLDLARWRIGSA